MPPKRAKVIQPNYTIFKYTVVQFYEEEDDEKLFECIPDRWFLDETKSRCYWPPSTGTAFKVRAMRCEKPDDSWNIYEVKVVSEGHVSYNIGFKVVREKCSQKYNTSSAEEQIDAANYRRKHPVLSMQNRDEGSIEHVFSKPNEISKLQPGKKIKANIPSNNSGANQDLSEPVTNFDESVPLSLSSQNSEFGNRSNLAFGNTHSNDSQKDTLSSIGRNEDTVHTEKNDTSDKHFYINTASAPNRSRSPSSQSNSSCDGSKCSRSSVVPSSKSKSGRSSSNSSQSSAKSIKSPERRSHSRSTSKSHRSSMKVPVRTNDREKSAESNVSAYNSSRSRSIRRSGSPNRHHPRSRYSSVRAVHPKKIREENRHQLDISRSKPIKRSQNENTKTRINSSVKKSVKSRRSRSRHGSNSTYKSRSNYATSSSSRSIRSRSRRSVCLSSSRSARSSRRRSVRQNRSRSVRPRKSNSVRPRRSRSVRPRRSRSSRSHSDSHRQKNTNKSNSATDLMNVVQKLNETLSKNTQQLKDNDRRLHRMELTVNKVFVLVCDLNGNAGPVLEEVPNNHGFEVPNMPIKSTNELAVMKRKLKDKEFREFFLHHERDFCCPTKKSTDTVTISKYLTRFVSLRVRSKLTLKESTDDGATLFKDYQTVYQFLIDVMKAGYKSCHRTITNDDAHSALRIVWGRSKQYYREEQDRLQR